MKMKMKMKMKTKNKNKSCDLIKCPSSFPIDP